MSLDTLVAAIDFLEFEARRQQHVNQQRVEEPSLVPPPLPPQQEPVMISPPYHSPAPAPPQVPEVQIQPKVKAPPTSKGQGHAQIAPGMVTSLTTPAEDAATRRRRLHNKLEKSRRATMRGHLNQLKILLPTPTSHDGVAYGRLMTTSATLGRSVQFIKELEQTEKNYMMEKEELTQLKIKREKQIEQLMASLDLEDHSGGTAQTEDLNGGGRETPIIGVEVKMEVEEEPIVLTLDDPRLLEVTPPIEKPTAMMKDEKMMCPIIFGPLEETSEAVMTSHLPSSPKPEEVLNYQADNGQGQGSNPVSFQTIYYDSQTKNFMVARSPSFDIGNNAPVNIVKIVEDYRNNNFVEDVDVKPLFSNGGGGSDAAGGGLSGGDGLLYNSQFAPPPTQNLPFV